MPETLLEKAQRLGIQPVNSPIQSNETLLQKAQRLGIKPDNQFPVSSSKAPLQKGLEGLGKGALELATYAPKTIAKTLAIPGQAVGQLYGARENTKTIKGIQNTLDQQSTIANDLLKKIQKETDPKKKQELRDNLKRVSDNTNELSKIMNDMVGGKGVSDATAINIPGIDYNVAPALPSAEKPLEASKAIAGRSLETIGLATAGLGGKAVTAGFGAIGAGSALEEQKSLPEVASRGVLFALGGKLATFGLEKFAGTSVGQRVLTAPLATKTMSALHKLYAPFLATPTSKIPQALSILGGRDLSQSVDNSIKSISNVIDKAISPSFYKQGVDKVFELAGLRGTPEQRLIQAQTKTTDYWRGVQGKYKKIMDYFENTPDVLGREGIPLEVKNVGGKTLVSSKPQAEITRTKAIAENARMKLLLNESNLSGSQDSLRQSAYKNINSLYKGLERQDALRAFDNQFEALLKDYGIKPGQNVPGIVINEMKQNFWQNGYGPKLTKSDSVYATAMRLSGNAFKNEINSLALSTDPELAKLITQLNNRSGELFQAEKFLLDANNRPYKFGMMGKHFMRTIGTIAGSNFGPLGTVAGMTAPELIGILQNPNVSAAQAAQVVRELSKTDPETVKQVLMMIEKIQQTRITVPKLGPGPMITPPPVGKSGAIPIPSNYPNYPAPLEANRLLEAPKSIQLPAPEFKGTSARDLEILRINNDLIQNNLMKGNTSLPPLSSVTKKETFPFGKYNRKFPKGN
jgi:hypothetical protein